MAQLQSHGKRPPVPLAPPLQGKLQILSKRLKEQLIRQWTRVSPTSL